MMLTASAVAGAKEPVSIRVSPAVSMAPATLVIRTSMEPHAEEPLDGGRQGLIRSLSVTDPHIRCGVFVDRLSPSHAVATSSSRYQQVSVRPSFVSAAIVHDLRNRGAFDNAQIAGVRPAHASVLGRPVSSRRTLLL